ncbi:hypothetical protein N656DRAFT_779967 [Canariomyces notabilis]|uniref:Uncharacterized protein n=1 Tax=Canariomyces notabilis TaxID=2074819 RepID=A0AAN6TCK1_9PEZI|nr:hypothetical protein N656DRAFT_779967 [Canariomyces arenarius]
MTTPSRALASERVSKDDRHGCIASVSGGCIRIKRRVWTYQSPIFTNLASLMLLRMVSESFPLVTQIIMITLPQMVVHDLGVAVGWAVLKMNV